MYSTTTSITDNIEELQADILLENLSQNGLFTASNIAMLNKALDTNKKNIVQAINEINTAFSNLKTTTTESLKQQYEMLGDFKTDPELIEKIQQIDENLALALLKTNSEVQDVKKEMTKTDKDIVFVIPKAEPDTSKPEIYFPYKGYLKRVVANIGLSQNVSRDTDIILNIEYLGRDNDWIKLYEITLPTDKTYSLKNVSEECFIDNKILRVYLTQSQTGYIDLSVIATFTVDA